MLTDAACKAATCPPDKARARFPDAGGLYLEVSPAGSKRWFLKYRKDGKEMRLALGSYPDVRLADARAKQGEAKALKRNGVDPIHAKKVAKLQSTAQAGDTFEAVARDWHSKQLANWSEVHAKTVFRRMERDLFPWIRAQLVTNQVEIPQELKERKGWLNYKVTSIAPTGKFDKIPIYPRTGGRRKGEQGAPADLANLGTWAEAWKALQDNPAIAGVGFACLAPFGVVALDVDHCVVDGVIRSDVESLIEDTYCEFSPSGRGIRAFWLGSSSNSKNNSTGYELFHSKGFVTVTGDFVVGGDVPPLPDSLRDKLEALATARPKAETPIKASGELDFFSPAPALRANPEDFKAPLQALARQYANNPQATYLKAAEALKFISADCGYDTWICLSTRSSPRNA